MPSASDRIRINDLVVDCHIGVTEDERSAAQPLSASIDMWLDLAPAAASDDVRDTIDYGDVAGRVANALRARPRMLLESAAGDALDVLLAFPGLTKAAIELAKLHPPIPEKVGPTSVRLERTVVRGTEPSGEG